MSSTFPPNSHITFSHMLARDPFFNQINMGACKGLIDISNPEYGANYYTKENLINLAETNPTALPHGWKPYCQDPNKIVSPSGRNAYVFDIDPSQIDPNNQTAKPFSVTLMNLTGTSQRVVALRIAEQDAHAGVALAEYLTPRATLHLNHYIDEAKEMLKNQPWDAFEANKETKLGPFFKWLTGDNRSDKYYNISANDSEAKLGLHFDDQDLLSSSRLATNIITTHGPSTLFLGSDKQNKPSNPITSRAFNSFKSKSYKDLVNHEPTSYKLYMPAPGFIVSFNRNEYTPHCSPITATYQPRAGAPGQSDFVVEIPRNSIAVFTETKYET